jgi:alkylhydroperoxidase/carboxymuconolactone decarboxylase family protein YurZ
MTTTDEAPLLAREEDHPQELVATHGGVRVIAIDSARYCDARNTGDVMVAASYCGVLPVRLMAPHRPRAVIGHDVNIAKDGSGIQGLFFLEALGIPAATVDGRTGELGNARDMYDNGSISRMNILAERCGVTIGMATKKAAELLATEDPGDTSPTTKVRRETKETSPTGRQIVVTDSIVFAHPDDKRHVLVTAGHTGPTGARFITEVSPHGFICADGGKSKNDSGVSGLAMLQESGLAGACYDVSTAAMGDAFDAWEVGRIAACNELAQQRGVYVGQRVDEAARCLLAETSGALSSPQARHEDTGSMLLRTGQLAALSPKFAEGLARVREVCDFDGALPAGIKALFMATAAIVRNHDETGRRELRRAVDRGVTVKQLQGAAVSVLISRGESVFQKFWAAVEQATGGMPVIAPPSPRPSFDASAQKAKDYFVSYFGFVPSYIELMADEAPRALEGYFLMREWALSENLLESKYVELLLCTVNAAEFSSRFVGIHAVGARKAGASEAEIVEAVVCAIPISGVASWLPGADGVRPPQT